LQKYQAFLLDKNSRDIATFFYNNNVKPQDYQQFVDYIIDGEMIQKEQLRDVQLFVKDNRGNPYIPGSSLKGAIRTALLNAKLYMEKGKNSDARAEQWLQELQLLQKRDLNGGKMAAKTKNAEMQILHRLELPDTNTRDAVNSAMRGISVSDSTPIAKEQLMLAQKLDYSIAGKPQLLPISRECLRPGTTCQFTITIDDAMAEKTKWTMEQILGAVRLHQQGQQKYFYRHFKGHEQQDITNQQTILWLGGGVGFANKTINQAALGSQNTLKFNSQLLGKLFREGNHDKDQELGISPHMQKMARYKGKLYRMGQCRLEVK
jgi:CRISPR-associated protein Csm5